MAEQVAKYAFKLARGQVVRGKKILLGSCLVIRHVHGFSQGHLLRKTGGMAATSPDGAIPASIKDFHHLRVPLQ
jgi:hypothetical protein